MKVDEDSDQKLYSCAYLFKELLITDTCADPESFVREAPTFFLIDEGREDPNTTKSGPSSARLGNAIYMGLRWWADDFPTLNAGLVAL